MSRYLAPPPSWPRIQSRLIPQGYQGTKRTVVHIQALICQGAKDFYVRQKAIDILLEKKAQPKDYLGEIKALFEWVQQNIRYTKDPYRVEVLHSARRLLELRAGDCDDLTILLGAMLEAIGHPVRLVLVGRDPLRPLHFAHIYLEANCKGHWIPLDPTMPHPFGWAPRAVVRRKIPIVRRLNMLTEDIELQGLGATAAVPRWLGDLIRGVRKEGLPPQDRRVRKMWDLLKTKGHLARSPWLRGVLRLAWEEGLEARPRPRTARRLIRRLRRLGILPMPVRPLRAVAARPVRRVAIRPVGRAVAVRPVRPSAMR